MSRLEIRWDDNIYGKKRLFIDGVMTKGIVCYSYDLMQAVSYIGDKEIFRGVSIEGAMISVENYYKQHEIEVVE